MRRMFTVLALAAAMLLATASVALAEKPDGPRCSGGVDSLGITTDWANHAQHVIGNYLLGEEIGVDVGWPVGPGTIGEALRGVGPAAPGAPGSLDHRTAPFSPGASFCDSVQP